MLRASRLAGVLPRVSNLEALAIEAATRSGVRLVYLKDSLEGATQDTAGTTPAAENAVLGRIVDPVSGHVFTQPTTASKPVAKKLANGHFAIQFNGSSSYLISDFAPGIGAMSFGAAWSTWRSVTAGTDAILGRFSGNSRVAIRRDVTLATTCAAAVGSISATAVGDTGTNPAVCSVVHDGTKFSVYLAGAKVVNAMAAAVATPDNVLYVGAANNAGSAAYFAGATLGLAWFSAQAIPDADRIAIERFGASLVGASYAA